MKFSVSRLPELRFGAGAIESLPKLMARFGRRALIVTGGRSFQAGAAWQRLGETLRREDFSCRTLAVGGEPSPDLVDEAVRAHRGEVDLVVAIGGGSAIDAGKAISAQLPHGTSVLEHLEGLPGFRPHSGVKLPFIACPTTAGTGAEASKNAVLSRPARDGTEAFKRSLRHDNLVPDVALIDPALALSCPREITTACGMDALSQLIEAYLATTATPFTDALALDGLVMMAGSLVAAATDRPQDLEARSELAYAAYLSGVCLANAGLGVIHGLAGPLGARFPVPHGAACGTLLAASLEVMLAALLDRDPDNPAVGKLERAGRLLADPRGDDAPAEKLVAELKDWTERLRLPRLGRFGVTPDDLDQLIAASGQKQNPITLKPEEVRRILVARL